MISECEEVIEQEEECFDDYVKELVKHNSLIIAKKIGFVLARIGIEGEEIETYVENGTLETVNTVKRDEKGRLDIVITMCQADGSVIYDRNGRSNTYIIPRKEFAKKYHGKYALNEHPSVYSPKGEARMFVQVKEDVSFLAPWGSVQYLKAGSFLNITKSESIYGVAEEEFYKTYMIMNTLRAPAIYQDEYDDEYDGEYNENTQDETLDDIIKDRLYPWFDPRARK